MPANTRAGGTKVPEFTGMFGSTKTDRLHVDRFGTYITTPTVSDAEAIVSIRTTLKNEYK